MYYFGDKIVYKILLWINIILFLFLSNEVYSLGNKETDYEYMVRVIPAIVLDINAEQNIIEETFVVKNTYEGMHRIIIDLDIVYKDDLDNQIIMEIYNRVVRKLQFLNNFRLKTAKCIAFCKTCSTTNRVAEQVK
jgi:hypothetical protein